MRALICLLLLAGAARGETITGTMQVAFDPAYMFEFQHPSLGVVIEQVLPLDWTWTLKTPGLDPISMTFADFAPTEEQVLYTINAANAADYGLDWPTFNSHLAEIAAHHRDNLYRFDIDSTVSSDCSVCAATMLSKTSVDGASPWRVIEADRVEVLAWVSETHTPSRVGFHVWSTVFGLATVPEPSTVTCALVFAGLFHFRASPARSRQNFASRRRHLRRSRSRG